MADTKWSDFPAAATVALTDIGVGLVGGANKKFTLTVLQAALTKVGLVTVTQPATGSTLTLVEGSSLITSGAFPITLTSTASTNVTLPTTGTLMANPMTTGGDVIYGGASGAPTRLANGTVGQVLTSGGTTVAPTWTTPAGTGTVTHTGSLTANAIVLGNGTADVKPMASLGTTTTVLHGNAAGAPTFAALNLFTDTTGGIPLPTRAVTGTSDTVLSTDLGTLVTYNNVAAVAVTLPQATGSFGAGWNTILLNLGAGTVTVTPTTSTGNLGATVVLATGQGWAPVSDGANYAGLLCALPGAASSFSSTGQNTLGAGSTILLTVPTSDPSATGDTTGSFNSGYSSSAIGDLVYLDSSATWQKAKADAASTCSGWLGIALEVKASGNALKVLLKGYIYAATPFPTFTVGGPVYASAATAGLVTQTAPTATDSVTRVLGFACHADKMYFDPSPDYITHT